MEDLIIIGAGGVGKEVAWIIEQINKEEPKWNILGYVDDSDEIQGKTINGYAVLGKINYLNNINKKVAVICSIANYKIKKMIIEKITNCNIEYANIMHPCVYIHNTDSVGKGVIIYPGVTLTTNIQIGNHVIISPKCGVGHETIIEDYVTLLWNVNVSGNDILEEGCMVGSGATIIQNKKIGKGTIIGAGAVVVKDIPSECVAVGIPAKPIRHN